MKPDPSRVAQLHLTAAGGVGKALEAALVGYKAGQGPSLVRSALVDVLEMFGGPQGAKDFMAGGRMKITGDWYHALSRHQQKSVEIILNRIHHYGLTLDDVYNDDVGWNLRMVANDVTKLESAFQAPNNEIKHGPFTLVKMKGVTAKALDESIVALDTAAKFLSRKFPQVVYGKVFVSPKLSGTNAMAKYTEVDDVVYLSVKARGIYGDVHDIVHEFGHRYFSKFWLDKSAREVFRKLSLDTVYEVISYPPDVKQSLAKELLSTVRARKGGKPLPPTSASFDTYLGYILGGPDGRDLMDASKAAVAGGPKEAKSMVDLFIRVVPDKVTTDKVLSKPLAVTPYGGTSWTENFAEAFAHYVLGKPLPVEIQAIMDAL